MKKFEIGLGILLGAAVIIWPDPPYWAAFSFSSIAVLLIVHGAFGERINKIINDEEPVRSIVSEMDIILHEGAPYEVTENVDGKSLSTIRMGIRNFGDSAITDCKVFIDAIDPMPAAVELPIVLQKGLDMPCRYPEVLVDIASQRGDRDHYSLASAGASSELDDKTPRTIVVRAEAAQCRRGASFKIWTDKERYMHIRLISHVD